MSFTSVNGRGRALSFSRVPLRASKVLLASGFTGRSLVRRVRMRSIPPPDDTRRPHIYWVDMSYRKIADSH